MLAVVFAIASAAIQIGMVTVLAETNDEPWQPWLGMLLGALFFVIGMLQYLIGRDLWGPTGKKIWRIAGWFFGGLIFAGITLKILVFHLSHAYTT